MKKTRNLLPVASGLLFAVVVLFSACASTQAPNGQQSDASPALQPVLRDIPAQNAQERERINRALLQTGPKGIAALCRMLEAPDSTARVRAQYAISGLAHHVTQPGRERERSMYARTLAAALDSPLQPQNKMFLMQQLQFAGSDAAVPALAPFLRKPRFADAAARALQGIGTPAAENALLDALPRSRRAATVSIVQALGALRSQKAVPDLLRLAGGENADQRRAAQFALANIGDARARALLIAVIDSSSTAPERQRTAANLLHFTQRRLEAGDRDMAAALCLRILGAKSPPRAAQTRIAALEILSQARGDAALNDLLQAMQSGGDQTQAAVAEISLQIPGPQGTVFWVQHLEELPVAAQARIISMLGQRGDPAAGDAVRAALSAEDPAVRHAAVPALVTLDGDAAVPALLQRLQSEIDPAAIAQIETALRTLPLAGQMARLAQALPEVMPEARPALIRILTARAASDQRQAIYACLDDADRAVRRAAIRSLGQLAPADDAPRLLDIFLAMEKSGDRAAMQKTVARVLRKMPDPVARTALVADRMQSLSADGRSQLLPLLARLGGQPALDLLLQKTQSEDAGEREAAIRALATWPDSAAIRPLQRLARNDSVLAHHVLALRAAVRLLQQSHFPPDAKLRELKTLLVTARRPQEKKQVLAAIAGLGTEPALATVAQYLADPNLAFDAALAVQQLAAAEDSAIPAPAFARQLLGRPVAPGVRDSLLARLEAQQPQNVPPPGFTALLNGRDLTSWKGLVADPPTRARMSPQELAAAQARADSLMRAHWRVENGVLVFDGRGASLCTARDYADFELLVDWKIEPGGDSGIYLRGSPQVQIWDPAQWPEGSGGLYNNQVGPSKPLVRADKPVGQWNTFRIIMVGEHVTVYLNDILVVDDVVLENYWERDKPIYPKGQIELQSHHTPLYFRNIFIRELPRHEPPQPVALFNGRDLGGWQIVDGQPGSWGVADGVLFTTGHGGGWLATEQEFGNFKLELDFRVSPGGNSGVFLRAPLYGDPAYTGMEIQVLDDYAEKYAKLRPWQYCGSLYALQAPAQRVSKPAGEWQHYEITCTGPRVQVQLNGVPIVDANLIYFMHKEAKHPGIKRRKGHIGLQSHTFRVEYRNIFITVY